MTNLYKCVVYQLSQNKTTVRWAHGPALVARGGLVDDAPVRCTNLYIFRKFFTYPSHEHMVLSYWLAN